MNEKEKHESITVRLDQTVIKTTSVSDLLPLNNEAVCPGGRYTVEGERPPNPYRPVRSSTAWFQTGNLYWLCMLGVFD